eukprot:TRINITY_DN15281_c0_g1_i1.p1 TRINITY_DN15281_c0_g1~~TRINITY_DN15281_c0_g1_i1.p1  ORF type:complete len:530 (-),score=103.40 TRINITY_DN15281_c0_g1_i1:81-1670(-)
MCIRDRIGPSDVNTPRRVGDNHSLEKKSLRRETISSQQDIRKVYRFDAKPIGHGHFGTVRLAILQSNPRQKFAVKTIPKEKIKREFHLLKRELEILTTLSHPNIVRFYESYEDPRLFHLVMELCAGGELLERVKSNDQLTEQQTANIMRKLFSAVNYLHECGICHRDLKPENFLFSDNSPEAEIKIIDFGLSKNFRDVSMSTVVGTALYVAPEVLKGTPYSEKCDEWSLGVNMFVLLSGTPPFQGQNNKEVFKNVSVGKYSMSGSEWRNVSREAKDLISKLLVVDPAKRLSAEEALRHPWFRRPSRMLTEVGSPPHSGSIPNEKVNREVIQRLRGLQAVSKFQKEAFHIISNMLTEAETKSLREAFRYLDRDNSGIISVTELLQAMRDMGYQEKEEEIMKIMKNLQLDGEDGLNYKEFIAATMDKKIFLTKDKLQAAFKHFDVDNSGAIHLENFREAMIRTGRKFEDKELEEMIREVDYMKEGRITYEHFCEILLSDHVTFVQEPLDNFPTGELQSEQKYLVVENDRAM